MDDEISIQSVRLVDTHELARLNSVFNGSQETAECYAARLADPCRVDTPILAWVAGRVIGLANLRIAPSVFDPVPYAELTELFVEEAFRRRGVGRALVSYAEQLARQAGAREMIILTDFYNHPAQQLYRSLGYGHHDIALSKDL